MKNLRPTGRGGTTSVVGEGLVQMRKSEENESLAGLLSSGLQPLGRLRLR